MRSLAAARGLTVVHRKVMPLARDAMRLFAVAGAAQSWVVQCRHCPHYEEIGVDVVQKLVATIVRVDRGQPGKSRGLLVCTGRFSSSAGEAAREMGIELVDYTVLRLLEGS